MPRKRTPFSSFGCLLVAFTATALFCVVALVVVFGIFTEVEAAFGAPSPNLAETQHWLLTFQLWPWRRTLTAPYNPAGVEQEFRIESGESVNSIAGRLQQQGLIADADIFRTYLIYSGVDTLLQAGMYHLSPSMTAIEIAHTIQDATPRTLTFSVLPGWRAEEIAASLPFSGLQISPEEFMAAIQEKPTGYSFSNAMPAQATAEGYLFPGLYEFPRQATISDVRTALLKAFETHVTATLSQGIQSQGLTLHEGVILASIVQRESIQNDEMPMIASVFYNRLAAGMTLSTDPTIQYALGYNTTQNTWWTNPLSLTNLEIASPYNTYIYPGLPPGPISNPGMEALQAVANPAQANYYYFRAACDGSGRHNFATTFEGHQANACP